MYGPKLLCSTRICSNKSHMAEIHRFAALTLEGAPCSLSTFEGQVLLIVNTASRCGFTPQLTALQALYERYKDRGFAVLGFPCNQFRNQDPGSNEEIGEFCTRNYGVSFPLFEKVDVNGANAHPLFKYLTEQAPGILGTRAIKWNFTKFLVDRNGRVLERYAPNTPPDAIAPAIERLLGTL